MIKELLKAEEEEKKAIKEDDETEEEESIEDDFGTLNDLLEYEIHVEEQDYGNFL